MNGGTREIGGHLVAQIGGESVRIRTVQDVLDLMGSLGWPAPTWWIVHEDALDPAFFDLKNRLAGEITQKLTNYRIRVAIVGDHDRHTSPAVQAWIRECNRGGELVFAKTVRDAEAFIAAGDDAGRG